MEVQFRGGPWDGVSIRTRFLPDQVRLQSLTVELAAEAPTAGTLGNACYWLRTPYNRDVYYEFETREAAPVPASEIARLAVPRSTLEP
jgi:hypothetical protein